MLVSTLESYFLGRKELFKGLAIDKLETEWLEYPVFHIDFNSTDFTMPGNLERILDESVADWEREYNVEHNSDDLGRRFANVLK